MISNQELASHAVEMLQTLIAACLQMLESGAQNDRELVDTLLHDGIRVVSALQDGLRECNEEVPACNISQSLQSIKYSFDQVLQRKEMSKKLHKIEFELLPLIQEFYLYLYYWGCVYPDPEKMKHYDQYEKAALGTNYYVDTSSETDSYKYDLSIIIIGYNKLEYTKICVDSLRRHLPREASYELILINHGSTDGTKAFFESVGPDKQVDIKVNGGGLGAYMRILEGRYSLAISNDVVITENAIDNMLRCMRSNDRIGMIVPATANISNLQTLPAAYSTLEELDAFAHKNNQYDPCRHERRVRLCNPLVMYRTDIMFGSKGHLPYRSFFTDNVISFGDDRASRLLLRAGYDIILQKDAYCHHFGSITIGSDPKVEHADTFYLEGRRNFERAFGVDPWGKGFCYAPKLFELLKIVRYDNARILGIDCGFGSNPLKIKELMKESYRDEAAELFNITTDKKWLLDVRSISNQAVYLEDVSDGIEGVFPGIRFHYVVIESEYSGEALLRSIWKAVEKHGQVAVRLTRGFHMKQWQQVASIVSNSDWAVMTKLKG